MAFQNIREDIEQIQEETKALIDSNIAYFKLWGFKVTMKSTTIVLKFLLIILFATLFVLFASLALAIVVGKAMDNYVYGFLIVAGFYLLFAILVSLIKPQIIEGKVLKKFSEIFFND
jgi:succinate-acetate transporter protein